jgi:thiamine-phosphate pyrophosphorylase
VSAASWALQERRLYLCTPDRPDLDTFLAACVRGGVDVVQLRDKEADARTILRRGRVARGVCADLGVPFILNDRPDLALELEADGVHVGQDDAPSELVRRIMGPAAILGLSTHDPDQLADGIGQPVDYLSAGPVERTATHPDRAPTGVAYASEASARASCPVFVTGGVTPATVPALADAGISHFVVVRWLTQAQDPFAAAQALRSTIDRALEENARR